MEKNNNDLFELMTKMYSELQKTNAKIDNVHNELKSEINNLENRFDNLEGRFDNLEIKIDKRFDNLTLDIGNLVTMDIADGISNQIQDVKSDIKFLTHKTQETEKDVYKIQDHLKIIK